MHAPRCFIKNIERQARSDDIANLRRDCNRYIFRQCKQRRSVIKSNSNGSNDNRSHYDCLATRSAPSAEGPAKDQPSSSSTNCTLTLGGPRTHHPRGRFLPFCVDHRPLWPIIARTGSRRPYRTVGDVTITTALWTHQDISNPGVTQDQLSLGQFQRYISRTDINSEESRSQGHAHVHRRSSHS